MDNTRNILVDNIKAWVKIDNEIQSLQKQIKDRRTKKKQLTNVLVEIMKKNNVDGIDMKNEKLLLKKTTTKTPLSKKHLFHSLLQYFDNDQEAAKKLALFIMNTRAEKINENIKRKNIN